MGLLSCPETSVTNWQSVLRNVPEELRSRLHCGRSVKSFGVVKSHLTFRMTWYQILALRLTILRFLMVFLSHAQLCQDNILELAMPTSFHILATSLLTDIPAMQ